MMPRIKTFFWVAFLCGILAAGAPDRVEAQEIHFGYLVADQLHSPAPMIMKEKKLLEAEGLKVKWGEYANGAFLMQHMASGEVDFGTCGAVPVMIAKARGVDVNVLAGSNTEGTSLIVKDSIKTPEDLDGKNIGTPGIGSIQDAMVDMVARKYNIKINHKQTKVSDMPILLKKGEIDGFIAWEPFPSKAASMGDGRVLMTSADILPGHQCCVLATQGQYVRDDRETARKVLRAYMKAWEYYRAHPDEARQMMAKYTGMPLEVIQAALKVIHHPYPPFVNIESMKIMAEGLQKGGKIQKGSIKDMDQWITDLTREEMLKEKFDQTAPASAPKQ